MGALNKAIRRTLLKLGNAASLTDGQLLARFVASGEPAAFEELVRRHGAMVLRVCQRILHHTQDADDAFQATFLVLLRKAQAIARQESVASWLYGVASRIALDSRRNAGQRHAREKLTSDTELDSSHARRDTGRRGLGPVLDEELQGLPEKYRAVVALCYFEGKTNEEAARLLGCQTGAVEMRLTRARDMLRNRLTRRGIGVPASGLAALLASEAAAKTLPAALLTAVVQAARRVAARQAAALSPASSALAEVLLRDMARRRLLRASLFLAVALLGIGGIALGFYQAARSPEKDEQSSVGSAAPAVAQASEVNFRAIARDTFGGPSRPQQKIITGQKDWEAAWADFSIMRPHFKMAGRPDVNSGGPPRVDFDKQIVIVVALGEKDGCGLEITRLAQTEDALRVHYKEVQRPAGAFPDRITRPYHVICVDKPGAPVKFVPG